MSIKAKEIIHNLPPFFNRSEDSHNYKITDAIFKPLEPLKHELKTRASEFTLSKISTQETDTLESATIEDLNGEDSITLLQADGSNLPLPGGISLYTTVNEFKNAVNKDYKLLNNLLQGIPTGIATGNVTNIALAGLDGNIVSIDSVEHPLYIFNKIDTQVIRYNGDGYYVSTENTNNTGRLFVYDEEFNFLGPIDLPKYIKDYNHEGKDLWLKDDTYNATRSIYISEYGVFTSNKSITDLNTEVTLESLKTEGTLSFYDTDTYIVFNNDTTLFITDTTEPATVDGSGNIIEYLLPDNVIDSADIKIIDTKTGDLLTSGWSYNAETGRLSFSTAIEPDRYIIEYNYLPFHNLVSITSNKDNVNSNINVNATGAMTSINDLILLNNDSSFSMPVDYTLIDNEDGSYTLALRNNVSVGSTITMHFLHKAKLSPQTLNIESSSHTITDNVSVKIDPSSVLLQDDAGEPIKVDYTLDGNTIIIDSEAFNLYPSITFTCHYILYKSDILKTVTNNGSNLVISLEPATDIYYGKLMPDTFRITKRNIELFVNVNYASAIHPAQETWMYDRSTKYIALLDTINQQLHCYDKYTAMMKNIHLSDTKEIDNTITPLRTAVSNNYIAVSYIDRYIAPAAVHEVQLQAGDTLNIRFYDTTYLQPLGDPVTLSIGISYLDSLTDMFIDVDGRIALVGIKDGISKIVKFNFTYTNAGYSVDYNNTTQSYDLTVYTNFNYTTLSLETA